MPEKPRLAAAEKKRIVAGLAERLSARDLANELGRDFRMVMSFINNPETKPRKDKGNRKSISKREIRKINRQMRKDHGR